MYNIDDICSKYYNTVFKYLVNLSHDVNLAEELTQETFYIAIKEIDKFKGECMISTWLCVIAKHLYYKRSKEVMRFAIHELNEKDIPEEKSLEDRFLASEERIELYRMLQKLDESTKNIIYLRMLGFSFKEIVEITEKNETWCKVVYHRGKKKLEDLFKGGIVDESKRNV